MIPKKKTYIGNDNYVMNSTTIDHDCYIEDNVVLSSNVILGGNVYIMKYANLGIKSIVHQNQIIGSYSMIGMGAIVTKTKKTLGKSRVFKGVMISLISRSFCLLELVVLHWRRQVLFWLPKQLLLIF